MLQNVKKKVMHRMGIVPAVRALTRHGCRILVYHRFSADPTKLAVQCEHIRRHFQPVSMQRVADSLDGGPPLPNYAVAVTVDDGYRDFLVHGQSVFSQYGIPVTVFLITGFIDRELWPWWDKVTYMFRRTSRSVISFQGNELNIKADVVRVVDVVTKYLKRVPSNVRNASIKELAHELKVRLPEDAPSDYEPLAWDEVRELHSAGVEFGAHTRTHPILSGISEEIELNEEIAGSKRRLDEQLGRVTMHFAYPNGTPSDYDDRSVAVVRKAGFATAVSVDRIFNYPGADRFRLARLDADPSIPAAQMTESLAGVRNLRKMLKQRLSS